MSKSFLNSFLLFIVVLFCSLDGFFRLRAIFALIFIFLFIFININNLKVSFLKNHYFLFIFLSLLFLFYTFIAFLYPENYLQIPVDSENFVFKIFDRLSLLIIFFLTPFVLFSNQNKYIYIFRNVAYFHVVFFIVQFTLYYIFNIKLDFTNFFGIEQRTNLGLEGGSIFRASGLYVEPSNYTAFVATIFFPYVYLKRKLTYWDLIPPLTMFLTFSTAGFFSGILYLIGYAIKNKIFSNIKGVLVFILGFFVTIGTLILNLNRFSTENGVSSNMRIDLLNYVMKTRFDDLNLLFLGSGIYSYDYEIYLREVSSLGRDIASIQDFTMFLYSFITLGVMGVFLLFYLLFKTKDIPGKFFLLSVLISKMTYLYPIFIFVVIYILYNDSKRDI